MNQDVLVRASALRQRVQQFNNSEAGAKALYEKYVSDLAALNLTPDTVDIAIVELEKRKEETEAILSRELDIIEEELR